MQARVVDVLRLLRVVYEIGGGPESAGLDRKGLLFAIAELCADSASDRLSSTSRVVSRPVIGFWLARCPMSHHFTAHRGGSYDSNHPSYLLSPASKAPDNPRASALQHTVQ